MTLELELLCRMVVAMAGLLVFWAVYLVLGDMYAAGVNP